MEAAIDPNIFRLTIFILSIFVGYYVVWSVTPALHTPLMAVTNAISSVIIVGGLYALVASSGDSFFAKGFGFFAVVLASVNIFVSSFEWFSSLRRRWLTGLRSAIFSESSVNQLGN